MRLIRRQRADSACQAYDSRWLEKPAFELRLEEEIYRAVRYGLSSSLVLARITVSSPDAAKAAVPKLLNAFAQKHLRLSDIPGQLSRVEFAICLPHTQEEGASIVAGRLEEALASFSPLVGQATFPSEGETVAALLSAAKGNASLALYQASKMAS